MAPRGSEACCGGECAPRNFLLEHPEPKLFVSSQWPRFPPLLYLIWRAVTALFFVIWIILSGVIPYDWYVAESDKVKWFVYLTNWAFLILTLDTCWRLGITAEAYHKRRKARGGGGAGGEGGENPGPATSIYEKKTTYAGNDVETEGPSSTPQMPWTYKVSWVLYNLSTNIGLMVTGLFWGLLYNPDYNLSYISFGTHGINSIYILLDFCISGVPVRIQHFYHSVVLAVIYSVFNAVYVLAGGTNANRHEYIYSVMAWNDNPTLATIYCVAAIAATIALWLIVYGLYRLRTALYACCSPEREEYEAHQMEEGRPEPPKGEVNETMEAEKD